MAWSNLLLQEKQEEAVLVTVPLRLRTAIHRHRHVPKLNVKYAVDRGDPDVKKARYSGEAYNIAMRKEAAALQEKLSLEVIKSASHAGLPIDSIAALLRDDT